MSVQDRMEELEEEMEALYGRKVEVKTVGEWLAERGYVPPGDPRDVSAELGVLLDRLADIGVMVDFADHLGDRELYGFLMQEMGVHTAILPGSFLHLSPIGGCSEEDNQIWLTYYATDVDRANWKRRFADENLPSKKETPFKRER